MKKSLCFSESRSKHLFTLSNLAVRCQLGRLTCRPLWAKTSSYWDLHVNKSCQWKPKFCTVVVSRFMNKRTWGAPCTNYAKHLLRVTQNAFNVTHQWIQASFEATESSKPLNCDQSVQTKKRIFPFCGAVHTLTPKLTHTYMDARTHIFQQRQLNRPCPIS